MWRQLARASKRRSGGYAWLIDEARGGDLRLGRESPLRRKWQAEYPVRSRKRSFYAARKEEQLVHRYEDSLLGRRRKLVRTKYLGNTECDAMEMRRRNLVEAKSSATRESIRMAVGQLLDYEFQGKSKYGRVNKGILVPTRPDQGVERWLRSLKISLIWPEGGEFRDNCNGRFV
jgi:hypothetical protein